MWFTINCFVLRICHFWRKEGFSIVAVNQPFSGANLCTEVTFDWALLRYLFVHLAWWSKADAPLSITSEFISMTDCSIFYVGSCKGRFLFMYYSSTVAIYCCNLLLQCQYKWQGIFPLSSLVLVDGEKVIHANKMSHITFSPVKTWFLFNQFWSFLRCQYPTEDRSWLDMLFSIAFCRIICIKVFVGLQMNWFSISCWTFVHCFLSSDVYYVLYAYRGWMGCP